jgi:hypothetical protein
MKKGRVKEVARDLMAFGSIPFLLLVFVRILMVQNYNELFQISFALVLILIVSSVFKKVDYHSAIIVVLVIFTSVFYNNWTYVIFATLIAISALSLMKYVLKIKRVCFSTLLALIFSGVSYLVSLKLNIPNL